MEMLSMSSKSFSRPVICRQKSKDGGVSIHVTHLTSAVFRVLEMPSREEHKTGFRQREAPF